MCKKCARQAVKNAVTSPRQSVAKDPENFVGLGEAFLFVLREYQLPVNRDIVDTAAADDIVDRGTKFFL
jgi:hypothetical protein